MKAKLSADKNGYYFVFSDFKDYPVLAVFGTRKLNTGFGHGDNTETVLANRKKLLTPIKVDYRDLACFNQVHGSRVAQIDSLDMGSGALDYESSIKETDSALTNTKKLPMAVFVADCFPVYFFDPVANAAGICHAGWRGTYERITQKTIRSMQVKFETTPENLLVAIGPGIRKCCYSVGEELVEYFPGSVERKHSGYHLDLVKENLKHLAGAGVKDKHIFDAELCTSCRNELFFSYRKEKDAAGRQMALMMLK
ncbi:MAG: peptidoglycan editing factor PgeF [Candidatus Omnitrophota bacterium]